MIYSIEFFRVQIHSVADAGSLQFFFANFSLAGNVITFNCDEDRSRVSAGRKVAGIDN